MENFSFLRLGPKWQFFVFVGTNPGFCCLGCGGMEHFLFLRVDLNLVDFFWLRLISIWRISSSGDCSLLRLGRLWYIFAFWEMARISGVFRLKKTGIYFKVERKMRDLALA